MNPFEGIQGLALDYLNENPQAGWGQYLNAFGLGSDPYSGWLRSQQNRYYTQYQGANAANPNLKWTDYLMQQNPQKEYQAMDPWSRGENPRAFQGRTRWSF
jgi:hypothetical protein